MLKHVVLIVTVLLTPSALGRVADARTPPQSTAGVAGWQPLRTAWGDPDVSGVFTNKDEQGVPLERPKEFTDRLTVTEEEFNARREAARRQIESDLTRFDATADSSGTGPDPVFNDRGRPSRRTSRIVDPADGRMPPMTPEGQQRAKERALAQKKGDAPADSYQSFGLFVRCITRGLPGSMMPAVYGNSYEIVQSPDYVAIRYEMVHETRIIPLGDRARVSPSIRSYMGDARGRWDGNSLVVETRNFRPESTYQGAHHESLRIVERFTPTSRDTLEWSVTVDDPRTWTRPWTFTVDLTRDNSQPVMEYACHEGNHAMRNMLVVARAAEGAAVPAR